MEKVKAIFILMRPYQWHKNVLVYAAVFFSAKFSHVDSVLQASVGFILFCILSSSVYVLNDLVDRKNDQQHPLKRQRPIAAGVVSVRLAVVVYVFLTSGGLFAGYLFSHQFFIIALSYCIFNIFYTFFLKNIVILDVFAVAISYIFRVLAGAVVIHVAITSWFLIASTLLALLLALGKRRHELLFLGEASSAHRVCLPQYTVAFLDQLITIVTTTIIVVYSLYTMDEHTKIVLGTQFMPLTIPFVIFGIFRYLYIINVKEKGGNPSRDLLLDKSIVITVILWVAEIVILVVKK
ncbi:MAG: decaprenyl-phosphate phosphoribosyltransferase [bacterium]|nr:decaprenyl-phosphate phosphoribosyltransferase [bacterium]